MSLCTSYGVYKVPFSCLQDGINSRLIWAFIHILPCSTGSQKNILLVYNNPMWVLKRGKGKIWFLAFLYLYLKRGEEDRYIRSSFARVIYKNMNNLVVLITIMAYIQYGLFTCVGVGSLTVVYCLFVSSFSLRPNFWYPSPQNRTYVCIISNLSNYHHFMKFHYIPENHIFHYYFRRNQMLTKCWWQSKISIKINTSLYQNFPMIIHQC